MDKNIDMLNFLIKTIKSNGNKKLLDFMFNFLEVSIMNIDSNSEYIKLYNMINTENRLYIETDKNMDDFWSNYLIFDSIVSKNKTTVFLENNIEHIKNKFVDYYNNLPYNFVSINSSGHNNIRLSNGNKIFFKNSKNFYMRGTTVNTIIFNEYNSKNIFDIFREIMPSLAYLDGKLFVSGSRDNDALACVNEISLISL